VLEGAKIELNDTDGSSIGNGYTRYNIFLSLVTRDHRNFSTEKFGEFSNAWHFVKFCNSPFQITVNSAGDSQLEKINPAVQNVPYVVIC